MNPGLPTVEPWAHLLWINQTKFCTGGLFLFFQSGHFDSPLSHFHNYACPLSNGVKILYLPKLYMVKSEYLNCVATLNIWPCFRTLWQ